LTKKNFFSELAEFNQTLQDSCEKYLGWTEGQMDRGKTVYPPTPPGSGVIITIFMKNLKTYQTTH
jgi:hypothetical protein